MSTLSLQARWVLPIDRPPIADGVVVISDGAITSVGNRSTSVGQCHDLGDVVLMPGLINAHTHLEFSHLDQPLGRSGMRLTDWIRLIIARRQRNKRESRSLILAGLRESLQHGVTTIGEIATKSSVLGTEEVGPNQLAFQEVIAFSKARIESALADVQQRLQDYQQSSGCNTGTAGVSPHAPYTVHPELLERLVGLACHERIPVAMHLAESNEEIEFLASGTGPFRELLVERSMWDDQAIPDGCKPLDYLRVLSRAPKAMVVHGNYLSSEEIGFLANHRESMSIVYCPRTHAYFGHRAYPLQAMLSGGVRVALGTDSRASNPDLSLLVEMRHVAAHHTGVTPRQIIRMGTLDGAEALGLDGQVGSITPGKRADLTAIPYEHTDEGPEVAVLFSKAAPVRTWLRGQPVKPQLDSPSQ